MTTINREKLGSYLNWISLGCAIVALIGSLYAYHLTEQSYQRMLAIYTLEEQLMTFCTKDNKAITAKVLANSTQAALSTEYRLDTIISSRTQEQILKNVQGWIQNISNKHFKILDVYEETSPNRQICPTPRGISK